MKVEKRTGSVSCQKQQITRLHLLCKVAGLDKAKVKIIVNKAAIGSMAIDNLLASMKNNGELLDHEAKDIRLTESLFQLFDENDKLAEAVKKGNFPQLPQGVISRLDDLALFNEKDWLTLLEVSGIEPHRGFSRQGYATFLAKKVEDLYPSKKLLMLVSANATNGLAKMLETLQPLFEKNESVFGDEHFSSLNVPDVNPKARQELHQTHARLKALANTFSSLRIAEVLDNRLLSASSKEKNISARIALLTRFHSQNPDKEFLFLDYSPESPDIKALNFEGFSEDERGMVLKTMKIFQGIYSVTRRCDHAKILLALGYHSPIQIANTSREHFISRLGLGKSVAMTYYKKANEMIDKNLYFQKHNNNTKK
jgi:hypothetical protein